MNRAALSQLIQRLLSAGLDDRVLAGSDGLKSLAAEIEKLTEYQRVHGKKLQSANGNQGFDSEAIALAVVKRARDLGVDGSIDALAQFLVQEERLGRILMLINCIELESPAKLGNNLEIFPVGALQSDIVVDYLKMAQVVRGIPLEKPSAVLVLPHRVRPAFADGLPGASKFFEAIETLEDARRCFTLFGPSTPVTMAYWWESVVDPLPIGWSRGWGAPNVELIGHERSHQMTDQQLAKYKSYWRAFESLPISTKRVLRVALERLNRGLRRQWSVDAAIELGVAMEAFFLSDLNPSEVSHRLALRCAWWLGTDKESRKDLLQWANTVYNCRSRAVHRGYLAEKLDKTFPKKYRGMETREFLRSACGRVLESIALALERGMPDWSYLVLGT